MARASLPSRLARALTIRKSQGIAAHEGGIVSFDGRSGRAPAAKLGLAFAARARAASWGRMAVHELPQFADFLAVRLTRGFSARAEFAQQADAMSLELLERRGMSHEALLAEHARNLEAQILAQGGRGPTDVPDIADMRAMLSAAAVAPLSDSATLYCEQQSGRTAGGPWSFVASFRAETKGAPSKGARKAAGAVPADEIAAALRERRRRHHQLSASTRRFLKRLRPFSRRLLRARRRARWGGVCAPSAAPANLSSA